MITKSKGAIKVTQQTSWMQDQVRNQDGEWVNKAGTYASWKNTLVNGRIETITYDNSKRKGQFKRTRFCDHTITSVVENGNSVDCYLNPEETLRRKAFTQSSSYETMVNAPLTLPNLASTHAEALQYFSSGCVSREFSLLNDIQEIGSTFSILKGPFSLLRADTWRKIQRELRLAERVDQSIAKRVLTDLKGIANIHLAYSFGVKPFIADLKATARILTSFEEKVSWLRKNSGKPVRVSFKKDLSRENAPSSTCSNTTLWEYGGTRIESSKCLYHAYAVLTYDVSRLSDFELAQAVLRRQLGVDSLLAVAWERVPYSFIVDWFVRIGDLLARIGNLELPYSIQDLGYSITLEDSRTTWYGYRWPIGTALTVPGRLYRRRFYRACGLPASLDLDTATPGLRQLALAASLFVQKLK